MFRVHVIWVFVLCEWETLITARFYSITTTTSTTTTKILRSPFMQVLVWIISHFLNQLTFWVSGCDQWSLGLPKIWINNQLFIEWWFWFAWCCEKNGFDLFEVWTRNSFKKAFRNHWIHEYYAIVIWATFFGFGWYVRMTSGLYICFLLRIEMNTSGALQRQCQMRRFT